MMATLTLLDAAMVANRNRKHLDTVKVVKAKYNFIELVLISNQIAGGISEK